MRKPSAVNKGNSLVTENALGTWREHAYGYITTNYEGAENIFDDPNRIFNADETACPFDAASGKFIPVFAEKGAKYVGKRTTGSKTSYTVLHTICANDKILPPFCVLPGNPEKEVDKTKVDVQAFKGAKFVNLKKGWQTQETFVRYLRWFYCWLVKNDIKLPVVLFLDNHSSHYSLEISRFGQEHEIIIHLLNPNSTNILQPYDVGVASSFRQSWNKACLEFQRRTNGMSLSKAAFPSVLYIAFEELWSKPGLARAGFRKTGIYPWDNNQMPLERLVSKPIDLEPATPIRPPPTPKTPLSLLAGMEVRQVNGKFIIQDPSATPIPKHKQHQRPIGEVRLTSPDQVIIISPHFPTFPQFFPGNANLHATNFLCNANLPIGNTMEICIAQKVCCMQICISWEKLGKCGEMLGNDHH